VRVLLTGAGGLLGSAFADALDGSQLVKAGRNALHVRDAAVFALVKSAQPELVVNCAAYVDADKGEDDPELSYAVNAMLPSLLATACRRHGAVLLQVSSTGCYGDWKADPFTEEDTPRPTTVHHRSKLAGEHAVRDAGCESLIIRTGWLYGGDVHQPKNFVWKRLLEAAAVPQLLSDASQKGNPTWVKDVVHQCLRLLKLNVRGTFNCVSEGVATRFDYVNQIVGLSGLSCVVKPTSTPFARRAPVSSNESALNWRLGLLGVAGMPHWTTSLQAYMDNLLRSAEGRAITEQGSA
jgi:dTDP-4-dehydrorhamnose reductase